MLWHRIPYATKPFAPACERNKGPILSVLRRVFADASDVLEIGSGTGQHAVWFAAGLRRYIARPALSNEREVTLLLPRP